MKLAVVIGRFQPFHLGHLSIIDKAYKEADKVLILVGSVNQLPDFRNPLTYEERVLLLRASIDEDYDCIIRPLKDEETDAAWIANVIGEINSREEDPTEVSLYTSPKDEEFYRRSFIYPVETLNEVPISATEVRISWYTNNLWLTEYYLPEGTKEFLENHHDRARLSEEYDNVTEMSLKKTKGHPFANPMELVSFAVIIQGKHVLVGKRAGARGAGQLGLPGGYLEASETSLEGCMREVKEELSVDLHALVMEGNAQCLTQAVEENMRDIGTRTFGVNYLFVIKEDVDLEVLVDTSETTSFEWVPVSDVLNDTTLLFYNHNQVARRLFTKIGDSK